MKPQAQPSFSAVASSIAPTYQLISSSSTMNDLQNDQHLSAVLLHQSLPKSFMSIQDQIRATILLLGLQFAWAVELSYGTPYLESLGLDKAFTSLVWLAGPLSGLIIQPLVGAISDKCTLPIGRRRPFIISGTISVLLSMLLIMFARELGASPSQGHATSISIFFAVFGFYLIDFCINAVQGSTRALLCDIAPHEQQDSVNAFASIMISLGNIFGYATGYLDLVQLFHLPRDSASAQLQVLCGIGMTCFLVCTLITCLSVKEVPLRSSQSSTRTTSNWTIKTWNLCIGPFKDIYSAMRRLPSTVRKVCYIQYFAWLGWFPVLFYSTTYVAQFAAHNRKYQTLPIQESDWAVRQGSRAVFFYSCSSFVFSFVLPTLARRVNIRLKHVWTAGELIFCLVLCCTFFVKDAIGASAIISALGFSWAITAWIPFAIIGQVLNKSSYRSEELEIISREPETISEITIDGTTINRIRSPQDKKRLSDSSENIDKNWDQSSNTSNTTLGPSNSSPIQDASTSNDRDMPPAGIILGIHNIFIVLPQLTIALFGALLFYIFPDDPVQPVSGTASDSLGWLFRIGGFMALFASFMIHRLPITDHH